MASLSDGTIRAAIKRVQFTGRSEILRDGEGRGTGRLLLVLRPRKKRLTTYWCAAQHRDKRKVQIKLGDYPSMGLAEARETFQRDYANLIQKRRHIRVARDTRTGTVGDLFDGYAELSRRLFKRIQPHSRLEVDATIPVSLRRRPCFGHSAAVAARHEPVLAGEI